MLDAGSSRDLVDAGIGRRLLSVIYESLVLIVIAFLSMAVYSSVANLNSPGTSISGAYTYAFWLFLYLTIGLYFFWCWLRGGQTLPMKTWKLQLADQRGWPISPTQALLRYTIAWLSFLLLGLGFIWAFVDRDKRFLHDRIAGTRILRTP